MNEHLQKTAKIQIKAIAFYQIIGGIVGYLTTILSILNNANIHFSYIVAIYIIVSYAFFSYSIYCGFILLKKPIIGLKHSKVNQLLQIVSFSISGFAFKYISGIMVGIIVTWGIKVDLSLKYQVSIWKLLFNYETDYNAISLNFIALLLYLLLRKQSIEIRKQELTKFFDFEK
jgi:hypothetical protein